MKLYTFKYKDQFCIGAEKNAGLVNLSDTLAIRDMTNFITKYHGNLTKVREALDAAKEIIPFSNVQIQVPVTPRQVWCSGLNYKSHVDENPNAKFLDEPRFFAKLPTAIIGPNDPIKHPGA